MNIESQRDQWPHRVASLRTAMPAPAPEGLTFKVHPNSASFNKTNWDYPYNVDNYPVVTAHDPKFMSGGPAIGHLEWFQEPTEADKDSLMWDLRRKGEPGEVSFINVRPEYRRHNVATTMFDWVKSNLEPRLHHSDERSELGRKWVDHDRTRYASRTAMPRYKMDPGITVHHHSDAETAGLAQEVLDQDGPYSLWDGLKSTGANMVARDPSGKIHGILALSDFNDVKGMPKNRYSVANINTSTEAPVGTGGRLLQEAAQKALADGKELGVHYVRNHARSWWSAMGANLNGSNGVWSPEGHRALALGEPIPVPHDGLVLDLLTRKMKEPGPYDLEDDGHIGRFPGTARYDAQQRFDDDDWDDDNLLGRLHPNVSGVQPNEHGSYVGWTPSTSDPQSRTAYEAAKKKKTKSPYKHWKGPPKMDFQVKGRPDIDLDIFERGDPKEIYPLLRTDANFAGRYKEYLQGLGYEIGDPRRDIIGKLLRDAFRIAALDDEEENEEEEFDGSYCKNCGPGDSDWCDACDLCDACDIHEKHCPSCGPNDSDWCEDCEQCMNCDYHDPHCSYCGPGDSNWCEEHEQCKSCDGNCESSDAQPLHLKTPLMRAHERPMVYNDGTGEHEYYFSPNEINPASEAYSRPYVDFPHPDDEDPTLDFGKPLRQTNGIDDIPAGTPGAELYRGLTVDLRNPDLAELRRAIYGDKLESYYLGDPNSNKLYHTKDHQYGPKVPVTQPGMFPGPYSDKELASPPADPDRLHRHLDTLLNHMENSRRDTGLGRHWSTDFNQAMGFSNFGSPYGGSNLPVRMTARWRGQGENPYRHETGEDTPGDYSYEQEMNLLPGAPVELHDLEIFHPITKRWHSLMDEPQRRTARLFL